MASKKTIQCRLFAIGKCRYGKDCRFEHKHSTTPCSHFENEKCKHDFDGYNCRYTHYVYEMKYPFQTPLVCFIERRIPHGTVKEFTNIYTTKDCKTYKKESSYDYKKQSIDYTPTTKYLLEHIKKFRDSLKEIKKRDDIIDLCKQVLKLSLPDELLKIIGDYTFEIHEVTYRHIYGN